MNLKNIIFVTIAGLILFACSNKNKSPKLLPFIPEEIKKESQKAPMSSGSFRPKVDILFVIDDSGSMGTHQANLSLNIERFTKAIVGTKFLDYHVGVITSTGTGFMTGGSPSGGSSVSYLSCCGQLRGYPQYIDRATKNGVEFLARNMLVGTNGSASEMFFDPVLMALSEPNVSMFNVGFYRPEAHLALIFITDTEDQSVTITEPEQFRDFLLELKGNSDKIFIAAAHIPEEKIDSCSGEKTSLVEVDRLNDFFKLMNASTFSLCDEFGDKLAQIGIKIAAQSTTMTLSQMPKQNTIKVTVGGVEMPNDSKKGWTYNPAKVAIEFGEDIDWAQYPDDSYPSVDFEVLTPVGTED
jgi:hypothetical protein